MVIARDTDITGGPLRGVVGELVKLPFNNYLTSQTGTSAVAAVDTGSSASGAGNPDGTMRRATLTVGTAGQQYARLRDTVYGRVVGIRFARTSGTSIPFDVIIDGIAYRIDDWRATQYNTVAGAGEFEGMLLIAENLPNIRHTVEVIAVNTPGGAGGSVRLLGWIGEKTYGYGDPTPARAASPLSSPTALPATATTIAGGNSTLYAGALAVGLNFVNTDTAARTITLAFNGTTYRKLVVAAGASEYVQFAAPRSLATWTWMADAAGVVNGWAEIL